MDYKAPIPSKDYKVLIRCFTYNQEKYIEDALKGFVRQKTNFPYCALVVDDCSTDRTAEIIKKYEGEYPDIIKGIYLPVNMYGNPQKMEIIKPWEDRAQYIAMCEGDDYWIDDYKLQRQVDFLDSHPEYMLHFHNAIVRYQNLELPDHLISHFKTGDFTTSMLFEKWQLPFASIMIRRSLMETPFFIGFRKKHTGSFTFFIIASCLGKVFGLAECLSVYRKNNGGVSNGMSVSYCEQILYDFAKAANDKESIKYRKNATTTTLALYMPQLLMGDREAKDLYKVAYNIDKWIPVKAFFRMLYRMPINFLRNVIRH